MPTAPLLGETLSDEFVALTDETVQVPLIAKHPAATLNPSALVDVPEVRLRRVA